MKSASKKSLKPSHKPSFSKEDKFYSSLDRSSFGAPRECFNNVVGPNKFNYMPFKASDPGPGKYGTGGHPFKEVGKKSQKYSMVSRKDYCYNRDRTHSKYSPFD
jgi:hypothetical protein